MPDPSPSTFEFDRVDSSSAPDPKTPVAQVQAEVAEMFGDIASFWGFTRTQGRVYGLLFMAREPMDHATIRDRLGISAGSASMTLASLTEWGALQRRGRSYVPQTNLWTLITQVVRTRENTRIENALRRLQALLHRLAAEPDPDGELRFVRARVDHLMRFFDTCRAFLDALVGRNPVHRIINKLVRRAAIITPNSGTKRSTHDKLRA